MISSVKLAKTVKYLEHFDIKKLKAILQVFKSINQKLVVVFSKYVI
jgi:hypothetical protein